MIRSIPVSLLMLGFFACVKITLRCIFYIHRALEIKLYSLLFVSLWCENINCTNFTRQSQQKVVPNLLWHQTVEQNWIKCLNQVGLKTSSLKMKKVWQCRVATLATISITRQKLWPNCHWLVDHLIHNKYFNIYIYFFLLTWGFYLQYFYL